jgi:ADP-ribose pyrophosphatase
VQTAASRQVFSGKVVRVRVDTVRLAAGDEAEREVVERSDAAAVVAVADGQVWLTRQHRQAAGKELLELPAGLLGEGEDPMACAARELREEVGVEAASLLRLTGYYSSAGFTDEVVHVYLATELHPTGGQSLDEGEELELVRLPFADAAEMALDGRISDAKTIIGLLLARQRLGSSAAGPPG